MLRISQYMREIHTPAAAGPARAPTGPVVIWNLVRRCNLCCEHCYSISADRDFPGELSTREVYDVMDDLRKFGVPVLIFSGYLDPVTPPERGEEVAKYLPNSRHVIIPHRFDRARR